MEHTAMIEKYFKARETSDEKIFFEIFDNDIEIYNVHFPMYKGRKGVKEYNNDFKKRISQCSFQVINIMEKEMDNKKIILAEWKASLTYRAGVLVGDSTVKKPFTFELRGVNRFDIAQGKITCLRIYHETTTAARLAKENS